MIKLPCGTERASEETVKVLIAIGVLYVDENGIRANEPGIYPKQKISLQTANQSRDR